MIFGWNARLGYCFRRGPPKQSCLVDYSLEIAAVKKMRDREDAITERETRALPIRRDRERQLDPASLLLWLLWCD
jgi:hypothetical protein